MILNANFRFPISNDRGVTLIEVLLSIFIIGLLFGVVGTLTVAAIRFYDVESARSDLYRQAAIGLEPIRDAGEAAGRILPSRTINGTLYTSTSTTVVLDIPTLNSSGVPITSSSDYAAFTRKPGDPRLLIRDYEAAPGSARASRTDTIARLVSVLRFYYGSSSPSSSPHFEALLATSSTVRNRSEEVILSSFITLQND